MTYLLSKHFITRSNQRGLNHELVEFLLVNGSYEKVSNDCFKVRVSKKDLSQIQNDIKINPIDKKYIKKNFEKISNSIIIVSDEILVTAYKSKY